jgi:hypothetical protein
VNLVVAIFISRLDFVQSSKKAKGLAFRRAIGGFVSPQARHPPLGLSPAKPTTTHTAKNRFRRCRYLVPFPLSPSNQPIASKLIFLSFSLPHGQIGPRVLRLPSHLFWPFLPCLAIRPLAFSFPPTVDPTVFIYLVIRARARDAGPPTMAVDAHELEAPQGGAVETAKDLFAGAVGGIAQVLVGKLCIPFSRPIGGSMARGPSWSSRPFSGPSALLKLPEAPPRSSRAPETHQFQARNQSCVMMTDINGTH